MVQSYYLGISGTWEQTSGRSLKLGWEVWQLWQLNQLIADIGGWFLDSFHPHYGLQPLNFELRSPPFTNRLEMFMFFFLENEKNRLKDVAFFWTPRFGFQSVGKLFVGPTRLSPGGNVALAFFRRGQSTVPKVSRHSESPFGFLRSQVRPQASGLRFLRFQDVIPLRCLTAAWQSSDQKKRVTH